MPRYDSQRKILQTLTPIVDRSWEIYRALIADGWSSLSPRIEFERSFCEEATLAIWEKSTIERQKFWVCTPNIRYGVWGPAIESPHFAELRKRRDQELGRTFDRNSDPRWLEELDPCTRRMARYAFEHRDEYHALSEQMKTRIGEERSIEITRHGAKFVSKSDPFSLSAASIDIFSAVTSDLGFSPLDNSALASECVFTKVLHEGWSLCLNASASWYVGVAEGDVSLLLSLQRRPQKRPLRDCDPNSYLLIEYANLVYMFDFTYRRYSSIQELKTVSNARAALLKLVLGDIERALLGALL